MTAHLTEEEQLETLKRWWAENGKSTVFAVILAVAGYLGWSGWQDRQQANAETAAVVYQDLLQALEVNAGEGLNDEQLANVRHFSGELKDKYGTNLYASQAALFLAKLAVDQGDLDRAAGELEWVIKQDVDKAMTLLSQARLARVKIAQQDLAAALDLVRETKNPGFIASFAELRGDILLLQSKPKEARAAYRLAIDNLLPEQEGRRQLLQVKLDDLQTTPAVVTLPAAPQIPSESTAAVVDEGENS